MSWMILAFFGGRTPREVLAGEPEDFNVLPGLFNLTALVMFACCQFLYWSSFPQRADSAILIASICTLLYGTVYWGLLRVLDDAGLFTKCLIVTVLAALAGYNSMLAGHEVLLAAYEPQVRVQATLRAGEDALAFAARQVEAMGLGSLRKEENQAQALLAGAQAQAAAVPPAVQLLTEQGDRCEAEASQLMRFIPADADNSTYPDRKRSAERKAAECQRIGGAARAQLESHQQRWQAQMQVQQTKLKDLSTEISRVQLLHAETVKRTAPGLASAHETGAGRYEALWRAVEAKTVPKWAAYGLMMFSAVLDCAGLVIKLLQAPDAAGRQRRKESAMACIDARTMDRLLSNLNRGANAAADSVRDQMQADYSIHTQTNLANETLTSMEAASFERIYRRTALAQKRTRQPLPGLMRRMREALDGRLIRAAGRFDQAPVRGAET